MSRRIFALILIVLLCAVAPAVAAQGVANITYGGSATGTLSAEAPLNLYVFSGNMGDLITAEVTGLEPGMIPTVSLLAPNQQVLGSGALEQLDAGSRTVSITRYLPNAGAYTLLIGGTPGQYILTLDNVTALTTTAPLSVPSTSNIALPADSSAQFYTVNNPSPNPVALSVAGGSTTASFSVEVLNIDGVPVARFEGAVGDVCVGVPGNSGNLTLILAGANNGQPLNVAVGLADGACSGLTASAPQTAPTVAPPVTTPEVAPPDTSNQSAACTASSGGAVNVRSGPGTQYGILTSLQPGVQAPVVGQSDGGWVVIQVNGVQGFVSLTVVGTFGNCAGLPFVPAPAQSQQPAIPTLTPPPQQPQQPTATQAQQQPQQPTATQAQQQQQPTATNPPPTATYTPSYTPTDDVQIAPNDSNYVLRVPLDGTVSVSDVVSYPDGDTEDVVSYDVTGLNNSVAFSGGQANLAISLSCSGTGTQYITFIIDGQSYTCGQTFNRVVNIDSRTGAVRVRATGGQGTYVQYTVTGTAPRTN